MRMNEVFYHRFEILLATIFCVTAISAKCSANYIDNSLREVSAKSQSEQGEAFYFFIPEPKGDRNPYAYVYDTKLDRLLLLPKNKSPINQKGSRELDDEDWSKILSEFILGLNPDVPQTGRERSTRLRVIELDKNWVKFNLNGRHIVLPLKLMIEEWGQKNFPLGEEIVDKNTSLPQDYMPDDLIKIHQKWNFHTPDYPKYLRRYVAYMIEKMLQSAEKQGVHIRVYSAFRSYEKQRYLYLNAIFLYGENQNRVAKPGHSEHQLGTTADLCGPDPKTVSSPDFDRTEEGRWLKQNAPKFGFYQSFNEENQYRTGYIPEPWHYRFYGNYRNLPCAGSHL
jgi:hypothetical protein